MTNATGTTARKVIKVTDSNMESAKLFRAMKYLATSKIASMVQEINAVCDERIAHEAKQERRLADGSTVIGQSNDIKFVKAFKDCAVTARLFLALKINPRAYIFPQSQSGGKSATETSSLKSYAKTREIAFAIFTGKSKLQNVCKVFSVCAYKMSAYKETLTRDDVETFLSSRAFRAINQGSADFLQAMEEIDALRAKHMSGGAATQASQMIRTLVALGSAKDVFHGREKHVTLDREGLVIDALMVRLGQITPQSTTVESVAS